MWMNILDTQSDRIHEAGAWMLKVIGQSYCTGRGGRSCIHNISLRLESCSRVFAISLSICTNISSSSIRSCDVLQTQRRTGRTWRLERRQYKSDKSRQVHILQTHNFQTRTVDFTLILTNSSWRPASERRLVRVLASDVSMFYIVIGEKVYLRHSMACSIPELRRQLHRGWNIAIFQEFFRPKECTKNVVFQTFWYPIVSLGESTI